MGKVLIPNHLNITITSIIAESNLSYLFWPWTVSYWECLVKILYSKISQNNSFLYLVMSLTKYN